MIPELIKQYVDTGKARYVYREFPLTSIHPNSQKASEAAVCSARQGKYWEMSDRLFSSQSEWGSSTDATKLFKKYAGELGVDQAAFDQCLDKGEAALEVQAELMVAQSLGLRGTPSFYVGDLPIQNPTLQVLGAVVDYLAEGGATPQIVPPMEDYHVLGDLTLTPAITVAFVDYASPESAQHAKEVLPQLTSTYIDNNQLSYILHPWAPDKASASYAGALAAECAGEQGKYWEMHDKLLAEQADWTTAPQPRAVTVSYAEQLGLDKAPFESCLDSKAARQRVDAGYVLGALYGVPDAPVFLFNNGTGQQGSPTFEEFKETIDSILSP